MNLTQAMILAGGKGTRLQSMVSDLPKPMAPIQDFPFLYYQMKWLAIQGIKKVYLSVGYKHESITAYFGSRFMDMDLEYVIEETALGTGGAILNCISNITGEIFVINGDTFFPIDLKSLYQYHRDRQAIISLALKEINNSDRYGTVSLQNGSVIGFHEKSWVEAGLINGGIYVLDKKLFDQFRLTSPFSFEVDVLQKYCTSLNICGKVFADYFIDIGIPEDYTRAQTEIPNYFKHV